MILFALGIIIGLLIRDIKYGVVKASRKVAASLGLKEYVQFLEPVTDKEKFEKAKTVSDLLQ